MLDLKKKLPSCRTDMGSAAKGYEQEAWSEGMGFEPEGWGLRPNEQISSKDPAENRFKSKNNTVVTAQVLSTAILHCHTSSSTGGLVRYPEVFIKHNVGTGLMF